MCDIGYVASDLSLLRAEVGPLKSLVGKAAASLKMLGSEEAESDLEGCAVLTVSSTMTVYLKASQAD
jgi:hypothetical protein